MFSKAIINSDRFIEMSPSARALYLYLMMDTDDEGFIGNPKTVQRCAGLAESDMAELIENGYIIPLSRSVVVITHFYLQNTIKNDRFKPTLYTEEKSKLILDGNKIYHLIPDSAQDNITPNQDEQTQPIAAKDQNKSNKTTSIDDADLPF